MLLRLTQALGVSLMPVKVLVLSATQGLAILHHSSGWEEVRNEGSVPLGLRGPLGATV